MIQVFFDGALINEDNVTGLNVNAEMFNESFKLGATVSSKYTLIVAKEGVSIQPSIVTLKDNGNVFAVLVVDNIEEDDYTYTYTLTDKMIDLEFYYDASQIFINRFHHTFSNCTRYLWQNRINIRY